MKTRKSKHIEKSTIAKLREITDLTQEAFAKLMGINRVYLGRVEAGRDPLSQRLAAKIEATTGASSEWLLSGKTENPTTINGQRYTYENYWFHRAQHDTHSYCSDLTKAFQECLKSYLNKKSSGSINDLDKFHIYKKLNEIARICGKDLTANS